MLIGLVGKAGVGKNYIASRYFPEYKQLAIATSLKKMCQQVYGYTDTELYDTKPVHVRTSMQHLATVYRSMDPDYWLKRLDLGTSSSAIITDVRYPNEIAFIRRLGGKIIGISGLCYVAPWTTHESENSVSMQDVDYIIYNDRRDSDKLQKSIDNVKLKLELELESE